jgi:hypothetical protein
MSLSSGLVNRVRNRSWHSLKVKSSEGSARAAGLNDAGWFPLGPWAVASASGALVRAGAVTLLLFISVFIRLQSQVLARRAPSARQRSLDSGVLQKTKAIMHGWLAEASSNEAGLEADLKTRSNQPQMAQICADIEAVIVDPERPCKN